ncbi:monomeric [FeFe] hydrogenase [Candidatus Lokiarchaeum ossiferum]|uniref:monomeric [FeFe] hydrogenase n=1 Tax=Candidatus Lokiarchaeum ossiferum TaxID=2951803 RepID=UPI00352DB882
MPLPSLNIFEKMRGLYTPVTDIRRRVLSAVARMIVQDKLPSYIEHIPYKIINTDTPTYRESVFKERAIVRERVRLAFGMDLKEFGAHGPINDDDVINMITDRKVAKRPIVNVIKVGCERCPEHSYLVTDLCRGCIAHPCTSVCPKNCVSILPSGKSFIDQEKCIRCGKCAQVCPYNAIVYRERPCAAACGVNAIHSDDDGFAEIDPDQCVSCGMCIVSCPFGAIAEKSEIVQVLSALKGPNSVYAEIAPAFVSQFGPLVKPPMLIEALKTLGFKDVREVAYGADVVVVNEAEELIELIEKRENCIENSDEKDDCRSFVGTSCCTAWAMMAEKKFPSTFALNISESFAPMVEIAKQIKKEDPNGSVVFIGPCIAKKEECFIPKVAEFVDFVITFEELSALFQANNIDVTKMVGKDELHDASALGRGFPVAGGVANAVIEQTKAIIGQDHDIPLIAADTLKDCVILLKKLEKGKLDPIPLLVEGMACPYGCVGGPGTLAPLKRAQREVKKYSSSADWKQPKDHL